MEHFCSGARKAALMAAFALVMAGLAGAQAAPFPYNQNNINQTELSNFDRYLDTHPQVAQQLRQNPSLANNSNYLAQHPGLQQFLSTHPGVRQQLAQNPQRFVNRERVYDRRTDAWQNRQRGGDAYNNRGQLRSFDGYLDRHPEVSQQVGNNPRLLNDPNYLANHPELRNYMQNHPGVRHQVRENPNRFVRAENRYDRREDARNDRRRDRRQDGRDHWRDRNHDRGSHNGSARGQRNGWR